MSQQSAEDRKWEAIKAKSKREQAKLDAANAYGRGCDGAKVKNRSSKALLDILLPGLSRKLRQAKAGDAEAAKDIPYIVNAIKQVAARDARGGEGF